MKYRYEATSVTGFIQQVACNYLPHGFWYFVQGQIPENKDPLAVDEKLIKKYGIDISRQSRWRRRRKGQRAFHYIRFERHFLLLATKGHHRLFEEEDWKDCSGTPGNGDSSPRSRITMFGYSLSVRQGHFCRLEKGQEPALPDEKMRVRVQVARPVFLDWKGYFVERAKSASVERLAKEIYCWPYEPYAPIRRQANSIVVAVNEQLRQRGYRKAERLVAAEVVRYRRNVVSPFCDVPSMQWKKAA